MLSILKKKFIFIIITILFVTDATVILAANNFTAKPAPKNLHHVAKHITRLPFIRQATNFTCGVAALQSIFYYYGDEFNESKLAAQLKPDPDAGTNYSNIAHLARELGYKVKIYKNMNLATLKMLLDAKTPVLVLIQAWTDQKNVDWENDWIDGHDVVAIGYDNENIYFMDPSMIGNFAFIPIPELLTRWHDEERGIKYYNFGMTITKPKVTYNHEAVLYME